VNQAHIDQYVAGRMGEAEACAFEEYCLANTEFARQVEYEQRLKAGITQVARGSTAEFVRSGSSLSWRLAAAASVLLFISAGFYLWQRLPGVVRDAASAIGGRLPEPRNGALQRGNGGGDPAQPGPLVRPGADPAAHRPTCASPQAGGPLPERP